MWTIRRARSPKDCERCNLFITAGSEYYERNASHGRSYFCIPCGEKVGENPRVEPPARRKTVKRARWRGEPLLGPGHIVHGLGRMGA